MQVSVESIGNLERRMQVQVPAERVSEEIAARLKNLSRTARLKGFRPGKAPLKVIRQQFGTQVHREVIGELLQSSYAEAVTQKQLSPAGSPRIEPQSMDEGQDLKYVATFEVFPEVVLQPIETLQVDRLSADVTESDIDAMIERLRKQQMKYVAASTAAGHLCTGAVSLTGTGERAASSVRAAVSPASVSVAGWMPRANSRSSARAALRLAFASASSGLSSASSSVTSMRRCSAPWRSSCSS